MNRRTDPQIIQAITAAILTTDHGMARIAYRFGVTPNTVRRIRDELPHAIPRRQNGRLPDDTVAAIIADRKAGLTYDDLAAKYPRSRGTIIQYCAEANLVERQPRSSRPNRLKEPHDEREPTPIAQALPAPPLASPPAFEINLDTPANTRESRRQAYRDAIARRRGQQDQEREAA